MEGWTWAFAPDPLEIRRADYSLSDEQVAIRDTFAQFFAQALQDGDPAASKPPKQQHALLPDGINGVADLFVVQAADRRTVRPQYCRR